jgi:hypothetical protein
MKNFSQIKKISLLSLFMLIVFSINESFSQQVITFRDGTELTVFITYQSKDTVKYFMKSNTNVTYIEMTDNIYKITPAEPDEGYIPDSLKDNKDYKMYLHYKRVATSGFILMPVGAVIGGIGVTLSGVFYLGPPSDATILSFFMIGLGTGLIITGIIKSISGSVKMAKYKKKVPGFSFDLKCAPQQQEIAVVYRF